jgi:hypothetical protein
VSGVDTRRVGLADISAVVWMEKRGQPTDGSNVCRAALMGDSPRRWAGGGPASGREGR